MKKTVLFGALAMFAIVALGIQTAEAQNPVKKADVKTEKKVEKKADADNQKKDGCCTAKKADANNTKKADCCAAKKADAKCSEKCDKKAVKRESSKDDKTLKAVDQNKSDK